MQEKKLISDPKKSKLQSLQKSSLEVKTTHTEELVIALCGPIGSPIHKVSEEIKTILEDRFNYTCKIIKLSKIIEDMGGKEESGKRFDRVQELINKGNEIRKNFGTSILADMAISKIAKDREEFKTQEQSSQFSSRRVCHIIDSIKNQEELDALKSVYREMFYFIGVFSPMPFRQKNLEELGMSLAQVYELIDRDSGEEIDHGQTVRDTFPNSDFFLRVDSDSNEPLKSKLERFLNIIFGIEILTPSTDERAMYLASSAAGNSACLSRQVGAALTDEQGEIISLGWNDVPKSKGDLYKHSPLTDTALGKDQRCMNMDGGKCFNDLEKSLITNEITNSLITKGLIKAEDRPKAIEAIQSSKIKSLLEFSRSIHAEMHAIILGSQLGGNKIRNGKLYCTTYPCHPCARHIIASGIKEVYYIEPYRKSLAIKLHADAISESETDDKKVRILSFEGIAPSRYLKIFKMKPDSRKDDEGKRIKNNPKTASPIYEVSLESLPALEAIVVKSLKDKKVIQ